MTTERAPLLFASQSQHSRIFRYHLQYIKSKAGILVLSWTAMIELYKASIIFFCTAVMRTHHTKISMEYIKPNLSISLYLLYPIWGLIADKWTGRYRVVVFTFYICFFNYVLNVIVYLLLSLLQSSASIVMNLMIVITSLLEFGIAGFQSVIIPFSVDQLMGASGDSLSAVIYWLLFCKFFTVFFAATLDDFLSMSQFSVSILVLTGLSILLVTISHHLFKHWLDTTPQITNPIKLIIRVLNYARKNKYARNRSALTYWEEDYPSRLDLGKEKYGGPLSEEEVEDVKTVLRLLPLLLCFSGCVLSWEALHLMDTSANVLSKLSKSHMKDGYIPYVIICLLILLYQFIIYPCFYKYIPSMLKRIGMGLVFTFITTVTYMCIFMVSNDDPVLHTSERYNASILCQEEWLFLPQITCGISFFLCLVTSVEFTVAQSPTQMRGLMVGLGYAGYGIMDLLNHNFHLPFNIKLPSHSRLVYYFLAKSVCALFILIVYLIFAKHYKLRVRDNIVPVHQIAEEHYERYIKQREEHKLECSSSSLDISN